MKSRYATFAGQSWARTSPFYDAAALLSDAEYRADQGAFFSMHGTLNHLLATDRIWMQRFTGQGDAGASRHHPARALCRPRRGARPRIDGSLPGWTVSTKRPSSVSSATDASRHPEEFVQPLSPALDHWFNHQTHHRGQAHMILTSLGKSAPELDLFYFQRLANKGEARIVTALLRGAHRAVAGLRQPSASRMSPEAGCRYRERCQSRCRLPHGDDQRAELARPTT